MNAPVHTAAMTLRARSELPPMTADALLVWQRGGNSGDMLILAACERYLRDRGIQPWVSDGSIEDAVAEGDTNYLDDLLATYRGMIVFPGGGNVGIYPDNGMLRAGVIARLRAGHRCLVFPQSALAPEQALVSPQVTVWCRDAVSRAMLAASGARTELVPDIALYMDDTIAKAPGGEGVFYIRRVPGIDTETLDHGIAADAGMPASDLTYRGTLDDIVATLVPYGTVISDRLHGGLIALMMRKKVILFPVGYHKIEAFHETWLSGNAGVAFVKERQALQPAIAALRAAPDVDYAALFLQHADPALQRFLLGD